LQGKSYDIPKMLVWDAWLKIKENEGAAGPDGVTIEQFEGNLTGNLRLHPDKTKIVYCQDSNRRGSCEHTEFSFLGFTFRRRGAWGNEGTLFSSFQPAISKDALSRINAEVRSWRLHNRTGHDLAGLAARIKPNRARLDAVLRCVLPFGDLPSPSTHQRLPDALDPQEVQTASGKEEGLPLLAGDRHAVPASVRALDMASFCPQCLVIRMTRAQPGDERLSRRDLWEPGGAIPPARRCVVEGEEERWSGRGRRGDDRAVRAEVERQPLPVVESHDVGQLFPGPVQSRFSSDPRR
jgi:hypothetical protein